MGWIQFRHLIEQDNVSTADWMNAINGNPNTPEDALLAAMFDVLQREDHLFKHLTKIIIALVKANEYSERNLRIIQELMEELDVQDCENIIYLVRNRLEPAEVLRKMSSIDASAPHSPIIGRWHRLRLWLKTPREERSDEPAEPQ